MLDYFFLLVPSWLGSLSCCLILQFIHLFIKQSSRTYCLPGIVLGVPQWEIQTLNSSSWSWESNRGARMSFLLVNVICEPEKNLFQLVLDGISINANRSSWLILFFRSTISLLIILPAWSVSYWHRGVEAPTLIIDSSISPPVIHPNYHVSVATSLCFQQLCFRQADFSDWPDLSVDTDFRVGVCPANSVL